MEDGEVSGDLIALGRIMRATQPLEPREILDGKFGGNDERAAHRPGH